MKTFEFEFGLDLEKQKRKKKCLWKKKSTRASGPELDPAQLRAGLLVRESVEWLTTGPHLAASATKAKRGGCALRSGGLEPAPRGSDLKRGATGLAVCSRQRGGANQVITARDVI